MKATDLDYDTACIPCEGSGTVGPLDCPICEGSGTMNRYRDWQSGTVLLSFKVNDDRGDRPPTVHIREMPIRDERTGGFEGRFGDWQPTDVDSGPMADYQADVRDQLQNNPVGDGGTGFEYQVHGQRVSADAFPNGAPTDPDLSIGEVIAWVEARGDGHAGQVYRQIRDEIDAHQS